MTREFFRAIGRWKEIAAESAGKTFLIYGGDEEYEREGHSILSWRNAGDIAGACRRQSRMLGDDPQERELLDFIEAATDTESWK